MKKPKKVYMHLVEPEKYPDFQLRAAKAVTRDALENRIQFSSLRGFPTTDEKIKVVEALGDMGARPNPAEGSKLIEIQETIDMYVKHFRLGKVLWPVYPTLLAAIGERHVAARTIAQRMPDPGYFMFGGHRFMDDKVGGHGMVDLHKSIVVSCNTYYYQLANDLGIDGIAAFMTP